MSNPAHEFNNGMSLYEEGQFQQAQQAFELVLVECPTAAEAELNLGNTLFLQQKPDEAEIHWLKAVEMDATVCKAYYNLGNLYFQRDDMERAYYYWVMFSKIDPTHALVLYNLGLLCEKANLLNKSYDYFKRFLTLCPYGPEAVALQMRMKQAQPLVENNLKVAEYNLRAGQIEKSIKAYQESIVCLPLNHHAYQHFASLLYRSGRWAEAAHWYELALVEVPRHYGMLINLGILYENLNDPLQALWCYHLALYYGREQVTQVLGKPLNRLYPLLNDEAFIQQCIDRINTAKKAFNLLDTEQLTQRLNRLVLDRAPQYNPMLVSLVHEVKLFSSPQQRQVEFWKSSAEASIAAGNFEEALATYKQCMALGARYVDTRDMRKQIEDLENKIEGAKLAAATAAATAIAS